jgi:hypothetical protein
MLEQDRGLENLHIRGDTCSNRLKKSEEEHPDLRGSLWVCEPWTDNVEDESIPLSADLQRPLPCHELLSPLIEQQPCPEPVRTPV